PGLDDGAKNVEESREMLAAYQKLGIKEIIATPHILKGSYPNDRTSISNASENVNREVEKELNLVKNAAAEHMLDEDFEILLEKNELLPRKGKYVLVEMSYFQKPVNFSELIFKIEH